MGYKEGKTIRIGYIGNFNVPFTTENDMTWSFQRLGHSVVQFQEGQWYGENILSTCIDEKVDILFYTHTHGWGTPGLSLSDLWTKLAEAGTITASFHLDYWRGLAREVDVGTHPFWHTKYVFTADGGSNDWYRKDHGINHFWMPPGVVERDCYYAEPRDMYQHDVIFVGSRSYHPEWPYRPTLVNWLFENYGDSFAHYGNEGRGTVRGDELNRLYRSAKVVVGDSLCLNFDHPNYWSDRVPETLGRGGFLIHPYVKGMEKFYKDGEHLVNYTYGDFGQLKQKIDQYLSDYSERERIRLAGHLHVKKNETYTNRVANMLQIISREEARK